MANDLKPALTAEEWALELAYREKWPDVQPRGRFDSDEYDRHALAALCLYQQPFGFTHADAELIAALANDYGMQRLKFHGTDLGNTGDYLVGLAHRIASLLPPTP